MTVIEIKAGVMKLGTYNNCMVIPVHIAKTYKIKKGQKLVLQLYDDGIFIPRRKSGDTSQKEST